MDRTAKRQASEKGKTWLDLGLSSAETENARDYLDYSDSFSAGPGEVVPSLDRLG